MRNPKFQHLMSGAFLTLMALFIAFAVFFSQAKANERTEQINAIDVNSAVVPGTTQDIDGEVEDGVAVSSINENRTAVSGSNIIASSAVTMTSTPAVVSLGASTVPQTDNETIVKVVQDLTQKQADLLLSKPGWLHLRSETRVAPEFAGSDSLASPSGQSVSLPVPFIQDSWYRINEEGDFVEGWGQILTAEGMPTQESVYTEGNWINLTFKEAGYGATEYKSYEPHLVIDLPSQDAASWFTASLDWKTTSATMEAYADNGQYVVTVHITFGESMEDVYGMEEPISGGKDIYIFDLDTGQLLSVERYVLTVSGRLLFAGQDVYIATEFLTELPIEVAEQFSNALNLAMEE